MATNMKSLNGYGFDASALGGHDPSYYATSEDIQQVRREIPTELPNPNALTFTGAVSETYDGSAPKSVAIPTVPSSIKNPNKLILSGAVTAEYDGSTEVSVEIPAGGGSAYELPIASATQLGGVKPVAKTDEMTQSVGVDENGGLWAVPGGSGGGESAIRSLETLAEGVIPVETPQYTYTNTGLKFQDIFKTWKVFYIQTYTTVKNHLYITGRTGNMQPVFSTSNNTCFQVLTFFSLGKGTNTVKWKRYCTGGTGNYWDNYTPGGEDDGGVNSDMITIRDISNSDGLYIRNYGSAMTVEAKWKVTGLIKWSDVQ